MNTDKLFNDSFWICESWTRDAMPIGGNPSTFYKSIYIEKLDDETKAELHICAYAKYSLWINGKYVISGPARSFPSNVMYDTIDIKSLIKQGENHIAVVLVSSTGASGYNAPSRMGLIIAGDILSEGYQLHISTDSDWKTATAWWYHYSDLMISLPVGYQEHFNANQEPHGWKIGIGTEGWNHAFRIGPAHTPPWENMVPRSIPLLDENEFSPQCVWVGKGSRKILPTKLNLSRLFNEEEITFSKAKEDISFDNSDNNIFTFDFGKTRLLRPGIEVFNVLGEIRIELYYAIGLNNRPDSMRGFGCDNEGFCDTFTPKSGDSIWVCLQSRGMRFMTVKITGEGSCSFELKTKTIDYPFGEMKRITVKDRVIRKIWEISSESAKSCTNDVVVDTCSRENVQWTFDAMQTCKAAYYTFGETKMWRRCLILSAQGIDENGNPKTVVPSGDSFMKLFDQLLYWVESCRIYVKLTQDISLIDQVETPMLNFLRLCKENITEENLFTPPVYGWHWVDWAPFDKRPYSLPINGLLILAADAALEISQITGNSKLIKLCNEILGTLKPAVMKFYDEEAGAFRSNIEPANPVPFNPFNILTEEPLAKYCLHGNSLMLLTRCGTEEQRKCTAKYLSRIISEPYNYKNEMGPGWIDLILSPLIGYGYKEQVLSYIKMYFGEMIDLGVNTWPEGRFMEKHNTAHGWGSVVNALFAEKFPEFFN